MPPITWRQKKAEAIKTIRIPQTIDDKEEKYLFDPSTTIPKSLPMLRACSRGVKRNNHQP